nr:MAG TPA: hypothetical protein [Caudoviricetes sp.]
MLITLYTLRLFANQIVLTPEYTLLCCRKI